MVEFDMFLDKPIKLVRNGSPNSYDHAPYLSECYASQENKIYIQCSKDDNNPDWQLKN